MQSMIDMEDSLNPCMPIFIGPPTINYLEERDKDISSDEDEEANLRFKRYSEVVNAVLDSETSCIDETEPPIAPSKNRYVLLSYLKDTNLDDYEDLQLRYE